VFYCCNHALSSPVLGIDISYSYTNNYSLSRQQLITIIQVTAIIPRTGKDIHGSRSLYFGRLISALRKPYELLDPHCIPANIARLIHGSISPGNMHGISNTSTE
jgi:hypothetical protein